MANRVKPQIIGYRLCHIALNRKFSHKFDVVVNFLNRVKAKSRKKKSRKGRHACTLVCSRGPRLAADLNSGKGWASCRYVKRVAL